jgi:hypothetical protein
VRITGVIKYHARYVVQVRPARMLSGTEGAGTLRRRPEKACYGVISTTMPFLVQRVAP